MWIASLDEDNKIVNEKLIEFKAGDVLVLPFGTLHAGDKNRTGATTCKVFSEIYTEIKTDSRSQLWVVDGKGYTNIKQPYQFDTDENRCFVN